MDAEKVRTWITILGIGIVPEQAYVKRQADKIKVRIIEVSVFLTPGVFISSYQSAFYDLVLFIIYRDATNDIMHEMDPGNGKHLWDPYIGKCDPHSTLLSTYNKKKQPEVKNQGRGQRTRETQGG